MRFCDLQLFDHCLAPDTMGDGTGCDNMTAVIVKFKAFKGSSSSSSSAPSAQTDSSVKDDTSSPPPAKKARKEAEADGATD